MELGPRGIRVNCVAPGWVETDMTREALADIAARREIEESIPLGRVAQPEDIAGPVLFLVSGLARHVQGEVVNVNGGSGVATTCPDGYYVVAAKFTGNSAMNASPKPGLL